MVSPTLSREQEVSEAAPDGVDVAAQLRPVVTALLGEDVPIRAEVVQMSSMSAHADAEALLRWMGRVGEPPASVYVTHGEPSAADTLRVRIAHELGWRARVPEHLERVELASPGDRPEWTEEPGR